MRRIVRWSLTARFVHWIHTISCLLLFYTGLALYIPILNSMAVVFGGIQNSRLVHNYSGFVFISIPVIVALITWGGSVRFLKEVFSWGGRDDTESLKKFPAYFFDANKKMPPQGRLKAIQKFAGWFILISSLLVSISGIVMYFNINLPRNLVQWMYPLHELSMIVLGVFLMVHTYVGTGLFAPYRGIWRAMFWNGKVSEVQAEYHWSKWAEERKVSSEQGGESS